MTERQRILITKENAEQVRGAIIKQFTKTIDNYDPEKFREKLANEFPILTTKVTMADLPDYMTIAEAKIVADAANEVDKDFYHDMIINDCWERFTYQLIPEQLIVDSKWANDKTNEFTGKYYDKGWVDICKKINTYIQEIKEYEAHRVN